jgi:hypothetical protein
VDDYENFEFSSPVNPWHPQPKFKADFDKIKCLELVLVPGKFLYIPAYWWYTFKFEEDTSISCFKYRTYMNNIAISPKIFMYALQNQNVERKIAKQIDIKHLQKQPDSTTIDSLNIEPDSTEQVMPSVSIGETPINNDNIETIGADLHAPS